MYFQILKSFYKMTRFRKSKNINFGKLNNKIPDLESQVNFLQETKVLPNSQTCQKCTSENDEIIYEKNYAYVRCKTCWSKTSIRKGTLLSKSSMSLRRFILLCYSFVQWTWTYTQGKFNRDLL